MAAVLIIAGALLVSVAAGLACGAALGPAFGLAAGMGVAGVLALWFGIDATRDVLPDRVKEAGAGGQLRAVGDVS
jgi:hypothetical protein